MAHPDLDALVDHLFSLAQELLAKQGAFHPFGASTKADGQIAMVAADPGNEHPEAVAVIELLVAGFQQEAAGGTIRAAGVCLDVRVLPPNGSEKSDAICAQLEHAEGECIDVYLPYKKGWLGRFKFGEMFAAPRERRIFAMERGSAG